MLVFSRFSPQGRSSRIKRCGLDRARTHHRPGVILAADFGQAARRVDRRGASIGGSILPWEFSLQEQLIETAKEVD